jgi:outer membrane protein OmpA-like peptidoglycan-associated protein
MPGIEDEVVFDRASSGLYDDVSAGRVGGGTFASVSRALSNPGGADAAAWAAQRAAATDRMRTGAIAAGAGVVGGMIGNALINTGGKDGKNIFGQVVAKERSKEINAEYDAMLKKLRDKVASLPQAPADKPCPTGAAGTPGNCTCNDSETYTYNQDANTCDVIEMLAVADNDVDAEDTVADNSVDDIVDVVEDVVDNETVVETVIQSVSPDTIQPTIVPLENSRLFKFGTAELLDTADKAIEEIVSDWRTQNADVLADRDFCIVIDGFTDPSGGDAVNLPLSKKRADAVKTALMRNGAILENNIRATGHGSKMCCKETVEARTNGNKCTCVCKGNCSKTYSPPCRRIELSIAPGACVSAPSVPPLLNACDTN